MFKFFFEVRFYFSVERVIYLISFQIDRNHWSLLILCHFGENRNSDTNQPCMLLLDSLQKMGPKRLEPQIRRLDNFFILLFIHVSCNLNPMYGWYAVNLFRFVRDIYRSEGRKETDDFIYKIPLLIPKVTDILHPSSRM